MKAIVRKAVPEDASFSIPLILEATWRYTGETGKQAGEATLMKLFIRSDKPPFIPLYIYRRKK